MVAIGFLLAFAIGLSLGLFGAGGSIVTVPIFHYVFGLAPHTAISSALLVVAITAALALAPHARRHHVCWRTGGMLATASIAAAYIGARVNAMIPGRALVIAFALVMVVAGVVMMRRRMTPASGVSPLRFAVIGIGVGLLTGMLGAGGGFVLVPALVVAGGLGMRDAVGTSLLVVVVNALAAFAGAASHAPPRLDLVGPVTVLALAGSIVGARLAGRIAGTQLQHSFGALVITLGLVSLAIEIL
jgi:uncharacterized membrane protein YfcA